MEFFFLFFFFKVVFKMVRIIDIKKAALCELEFNVIATHPLTYSPFCTQLVTEHDQHNTDVTLALSTTKYKNNQWL
jgi:hypothetical protein